MNYNSTRLANILEIDPVTLRRWCDRWSDFLTGGANPPKGQNRRLEEHDARVLSLIAMQRRAGYSPDDITEQLNRLKTREWTELPELPDEWLEIASQSGRLLPIEEAAARAGEMTQVAVLRTQLDNARKHVADLETERDYWRTKAEEREAKLSELEVELHEFQLKLARAEALSQQVNEYRTRVQALEDERVKLTTEIMGLYRKVMDGDFRGQGDPE